MIFVRGLLFLARNDYLNLLPLSLWKNFTAENGEQACFECLFEREKLGNSGLGNGVAMPKAKLPATVSDKILDGIYAIRNACRI